MNDTEINLIVNVLEHLESGESNIFDNVDGVAGTLATTGTWIWAAIIFLLLMSQLGVVARVIYGQSATQSGSSSHRFWRTSSWLFVFIVIAVAGFSVQSARASIDYVGTSDDTITIDVDPGSKAEGNHSFSAQFDYPVPVHFALLSQSTLDLPDGLQLQLGGQQLRNGEKVQFFSGVPEDMGIKYQFPVTVGAAADVRPGQYTFTLHVQLKGSGGIWRPDANQVGGGYCSTNEVTSKANCLSNSGTWTANPSTDGGGSCEVDADADLLSPTTSQTTCILGDENDHVWTPSGQCYNEMFATSERNCRTNSGFWDSEPEISGGGTCIPVASGDSKLECEEEVNGQRFGVWVPQPDVDGGGICTIEGVTAQIDCYDDVEPDLATTIVGDGDFGSLTYGYAAQTARQVQITDTGGTGLNVDITLMDTSDFELVTDAAGTATTPKCEVGVVPAHATTSVPNCFVRPKSGKPYSPSTYDTTLALRHADSQDLLGVFAHVDYQVTKFVTNLVATVADRIYDGTDIATLSGIGYSPTLAGETLTVSGCVGRFSSKTADGGKDVTITNCNLVGSTVSNYLLQIPLIKASISKFNIAVSNLVIQDKVYDGNDDTEVNMAGTIFTPSLITGDIVSVTECTGVFDSAQAGSGITVGLDNPSCALAGVDANNYNVTAWTQINSMATIHKANQLPLVINNYVDYGDSNVAVQISGGSGFGAYTLTSSGPCTIGAYDGSNKLPFLQTVSIHNTENQQTCTLTLSRTADDNHNAVANATFSYTTTLPSEGALPPGEN